MSNITFSSKTFHLWPFGGRGKGFLSWRGFSETNEVTINESEFVIDWKKGKNVFSTKELEFCIVKHRCMKLANAKVYVGMDRSIDKPKDWNYVWRFMSHDYFYIDEQDLKQLENTLRSHNPICYSSDSRVVYSKAPWYRIDMLISDNRSSMWINKKHILSSFNIDRPLWGGLDIDKVKYFYTKGMLTRDLFVGAESSLKLLNVTSENVKEIKDFLMNNGANFASDADIEYNDMWTPNVIFSPSLWFTHSSIGFTDAGLVYKQKTLKTDDTIFLPWNKINMASEEGKLSWLFTKSINIFGEQNILPKRRYPKKAVKEIIKTLEEKGVKSFDGKTFQASHHTSWFGILLSIVTLSIYHWIIVALGKMKKRDSLVIGDKKMMWDGKFFYYNSSDEDDWWTKKLSEETKIKTLVAENTEVWDVWFVKKRWYHLWGYELVRVWPHNIRAFDNLIDKAGADQHSVYYVFIHKKIWTWNASAIKKEFVNNGYRYEAVDEKYHKIFKKWAKLYVKENC